MAGELLPILNSAAPAKFFEEVGGTLADGWGSLIGDRVSSYRLKNAARLHEKLRKEFEKSGNIPVWERVPDRFAVSWFEAATQEDDEDIQDLFAKLLAHAATGGEDASARRNIDLVASLTPESARFLKHLYEEYWGNVEKSNTDIIHLDDFESLEHALASSRQFDRQSFEDLERLNVIDVERVSSINASKLERWLRGQTGQDGGSMFTTYPVEDAVVIHDEVNLTVTGLSLMRALFLG